MKNRKHDHENRGHELDLEELVKVIRLHGGFQSVTRPHNDGFTDSSDMVGVAVTGVYVDGVFLSD